MNRALLFLLALLCAASLSAQPKWISMQNENFRVYSSASERETRDSLANFERVRGFFLQFTGAPPPKPVPVSIVIFGSEKEYLPYRIKEFAIAYYASQSDRDFIVVGKVGDESARIATHEYTHLVFKHFGYTLPPWLNEGMAELFSTLKPLGSSTEFGSPIAGRLYGLSTDKWVPLETILSADEKSPFYNETQRAGNLYNEGWALVHMLATTTEYRPKFWDVVKAVQAGTPSVKALEAAYGMPFAKIESELKTYVRGDGFRKLVTKLRLEDMDKIKAQPADMYDVRTAQAELLMGLQGKQAEARTRFEDLTREDAKRAEPWSNLGYLVWRDGKAEVALDHFAKSYQLGNRSPRMLYDYARLASRQRPEEAITAFKDLIEIEATNSDARLDLANLQMSQRQYAEALVTVKGITSVKTADQRDRVLYMRAYSALQSGDRVDAQARADELQRLTTSEEYKTRANDLLRFLSQPQRTVQTAPPAAVRAPSQGIIAEAEIERPAIQRREAQPTARADMEIILQDIRGTLVEMDCSTPPRFLLSTEQGLKKFVILQPDRLVVTGRSGGAQFSCGLQKPVVEIRLQYTIAPEGSDADGVVRAVHFGEAK
ncbi:MAG: tetratricopeptide repeat protein [Bryobacteraceae bacterium]